MEEDPDKKVKLNSRQKRSIVICGVITWIVWSAWLVARFTLGGWCERPRLEQEFDRARYLGRWYEMYREQTVPFESYDCATATYVELPKNYIEVNNIEYSIQDKKFPKGDPLPAGKA